MNKTLLIPAIALLALPFVAHAETTPNPPTAKTSAEATVATPAPDKKPEKTKAKSCNPKKSKACGNACIPLKRTCHK